MFFRLVLPKQEAANSVVADCFILPINTQPSRSPLGDKVGTMHEARKYPASATWIEAKAPDGVRRGKMARLTGLEPATPGVTGRYSNQLSYNRA